MRYLRGVCFSLWTLACSLAQADTIPTLAATSASADWVFEDIGKVSGPYFDLEAYTDPRGLTYPCATPVPVGGCVAPGPVLPLQFPNDDAQGTVTLGGVTYPVYFRGNAQIQYLTPTIVYPDPAKPYPENFVYIPVVLSGSEVAYLQTSPTFIPFANISINLLGTLTIFATQIPGEVLVQSSFTSTPVPEPGSIAFVCIGFLVFMAVCSRVLNK